MRDTPRVILGCPLAGIAADEILDATPMIDEIRDRFVGTTEFSNLPRKYKSSISGCVARCTDPEINDISLVGVEHPELGPGFDLWVGGGLSTNPMFAQRLEAFVEPERAAETWAAVTSLYREYGYRRSRNQSRLKFLIKDWGAEEFRRVLEKEFLDEPLPDGPAPPPAPMDVRDHVGVHPQLDGRAFVGFAPRAGRLSGHQLRLIADLADRHGSGKIRTTTRQKFVITDVEEESVAELAASLDALDLPTIPSPFRKGVMACTGIEFCKLAIGETKGRARWLAEELDARLPGLDEEIRIHVNGCPNSCARFQVADIGLMSALAPRPDGTKSDAFLVHLGGGMGDGESFGRKVKGVRIFAEDAADYVETLVKRYRARRGPEAPGFTEFVRGLDDVELTAFADPEAGR